MRKRRGMKIYAYNLEDSFIGIFSSQNEAERKLQVGSGNVSRVVNGKLDAAWSETLNTLVRFSKEEE